MLVIGLGYVGLVQAAALAERGHEVTGIDIDLDKYNSLRNGRVSIYEPDLPELIKPGLKKGHLTFLHLSEIKEISVPLIFIAVGTPSLPFNGNADLSQIQSAIQWIKDNIRNNAVIVMKSTVLPGTGQSLINKYLKDSRFSYVSNPEFLREGQAVYDWYHPDRIVIGCQDQEAGKVVSSLYNGIKAPVLITDINSAELIKYASNAFLATKISFINEIANVCELIDADIELVSEGIGLDSRIGKSFLKAGIGYGGSCFPKDVRALDYFSSMNGYSFELLKSVISVNNRQRSLPVKKLKEALGDLNGKKVAVLGLAFKPNTDDIREAPAIDIINMLLNEGCEVRACDPVAVGNTKKVLPSEVKLFESLPGAIGGAQAAILTTEWEEFVNFDWTSLNDIMSPPRLIIDGRNALRHCIVQNPDLKYVGIGRGIK